LVSAPVQQTTSTKAKLGLKEIIAQSKDAVSIYQNQPTKEETILSQEPTEEVATETYDQSAIEAAWNGFIENANLPLGQLLTALKTAQIKYLPEQQAVQFSFPSETQVIYFNDVRGDIASFFKSKQLPGLRLETYIQKDDERIVSLLTDGQIFESWRKENPVLEDLYRLFQLRIE
jgi:hypothetical protein